MTADLPAQTDSLHAQSLTPKHPTRVRFLRQHELVDKVMAYDPTADEEALNRAYVYATVMHGSQKRASGDPYFAHPIEVAGILTDYRLDQDAIIAALLHDTIEDTDASFEDITMRFGPVVAELVEGVTKLTKLELRSEYTKQSENLRKFILAISRDIRILLVKLADRLHNMRTLQYVKIEKRERIARETLDIYAPLARQIGCYRISSELEDLAFSHINPRAFAAIKQRLDDMASSRVNTIKTIEEDIQGLFDVGGLKASVHGRQKSPYSIWRKLQSKKTGFSQLSDILAFRVVTQTVEDCYRALGLLHMNWTFVAGRFKDYISTPKTNAYRSIHTTMVGHKGTRIEVQIRSEEMDRVAEDGLAAHWVYKNHSYGFDEKAVYEISMRNPLSAIRNLINLAETGLDSDEWLDHAKLEMFTDQVFCFTPKGKVITLPQGAMPLDFAYAIHTSVGDNAIGCKINDENRPLRSVLTNGDKVEILIGLEPRVNEDWVSLCLTGRAKSAIRRHLSKSAREDYIKLGRLSLERGIKQIGRSLDRVSFVSVLERLTIPSEDQLFEWVGRGRISVTKVLESLYPGQTQNISLQFENLPRIKDGEAGFGFVHGGALDALKNSHEICFSRCCFPVPGERIVGIVAEKTVYVHAIDCQALSGLDEVDARWIDLHWTLTAEKHALCTARLSVVLRNLPGVLGEACSLIGETRGNIVNIHIDRHQLDYLDIDFDIEVVDAKHLSQIAAALRASRQIESVERYRGLLLKGSEHESR